MNWPTHSDYQDAIQNPGVCFQDPELKGGTARTDMLGLPRVMSGNFASVYEMHCNDVRWAVRCFVRQVPGQQGRYSRLSQHLNSVTTPYLVDFEYMPKGILVKGEWYAIVKMQWVEGVPLNTFVEEHVNEPEVLKKLAADWRTMMNELNHHRLAHGDLQHGNIMVTPGAELRLVDYDGMYAPVFGRGRAPELGHINFQHPRRTADFYQEDLDNFSALVIYMSLRAIAAEPELFQKFYTVDNLILSSSDFKNPLNSPLFTRLKQSPDLGVQQLAKLLEKCCTGSAESVPDFADVMAALDAGSSLESMQMKTAPVVTMSRPAPETPGSRPAPQATSQPRPGSRSTTRSAYDNVPTAKPTTTSTFQQKPLQQSRPAPAAVQQPQPQPAGGSMPPWVWALVGAAVVAIVGAILFVKFAAHPAAQPPAAQPETPAPAATPAEPVAPQPKAQAPVERPVHPAQRGDNIKLTLLGSLRGHSGSVDAVKFSVDGKMLVSAGADKTVRVWDAQTGEPKKILSGAGEALVSIAISPDDRTIAAVTADNRVVFWDVASGQQKKILESEKNNLFPVVLYPDAALLATGGTDRKTVRLIDPDTGITKKVLANHSSWIKGVSFSASGSLAAVVCHDDSINVWNLADSQLIQSFSSPGNMVDVPVFSNDGRFLAAGGEGRNVKIWDLQVGSMHQNLSDHAGDVKACAFSPDRKWIATGSADRTVKVWEVFTGQLKQTLTGSEGTLNSLVFSSDGTLLAAGSGDQSVRLWQTNF